MALATACQHEDNAFPACLAMRWGLPEGERVHSRMPFIFFNYESWKVLITELQALTGIKHRGGGRCTSMQENMAHSLRAISCSLLGCLQHRGVRGEGEFSELHR